jgi:mannose-6-phosphate isomerase
MRPGQAILQEAGVIHSYLNGPIIEVMQASDNVVRAGITNKPINLEELLKLMRFQSQTPQLIEGRDVGNETFFDTNVDEFLVSRITFNPAQNYAQTTTYAEVLMGMEGNATITSNGITLPLSKGKSIFISAGTEYELHGSENDTVYRTSIPLK